MSHPSRRKRTFTEYERPTSTGQPRRSSGSGSGHPSSSHSHPHSHEQQPEWNPSTVLEVDEADLVHGQEAVGLSLETHHGKSKYTTEHHVRVAPVLIEWKPDRPDVDLDAADQNQKFPIWVDRYDSRLLLSCLPSSPSAGLNHPSSNSNSNSTSATSPQADPDSGWDDLPSDSEDTFFFAPFEAEEYRRGKRRRMMDRHREERLRMIRAEEERVGQLQPELHPLAGDQPEPQEDWPSDEEPDELQTQLMRKTASHIYSSSNPGQLEMRILADQGRDPKFAFLRGRWKRSWVSVVEEQTSSTLMRTKVNEVESKNVASAPALSGLYGYGDSDSSHSEEG